MADRYGWQHRQVRKRWAPLVEQGTVTCWRCGRLIQPGAPWHLGHDDVMTEQHRGPEHVWCNTSAGNRSWRRGRRRRRVVVVAAPTIRQPPTAARW